MGKISQVFFGDITPGRVITQETLSGIGQGLVSGTRVSSAKLTEEILADDFAITPYRRWLAGMSGNDQWQTLSEDINSSVNRAKDLKTEIRDMSGQIKKLRKEGGTVEATVREVTDKLKYDKLVQVLKDRGIKNTDDIDIEAGEGSIALLKKHGKFESDQQLATYLNENIKGLTYKDLPGIKTSAGDSLGERIPGDTVDKKKTFTLNDLIKEHNSKVAERESNIDKVRKSTKKYNDTVPSKTELERIVGINLQQEAERLRRAYRRSLTTGNRELALKDTLFRDLKDDIEKLEALGNVPIAGTKYKIGDFVDEVQRLRGGIIASDTYKEALDNFYNPAVTIASMLKQIEEVPRNFFQVIGDKIRQKSPGVQLRLTLDELGAIEKYGAGAIRVPQQQPGTQPAVQPQQRRDIESFFEETVTQPQGPLGGPGAVSPDELFPE